jgi:acyl carrier protein phosphodiesterase
VNHLAHALLGAGDEDLMLGSLMADFLRGSVDPALPRGVRAGIALHRSVDRYTDEHVEVAQARALFRPPMRRYAGILLDIWFDHLLARDWARFGPGSLEDFSDRVRDLLQRRIEEQPQRMQGFVHYLHANGLPAAYRQRAMIDDVLRGVSARLARPNPIAQALPLLEEAARPLERHFEVFFPHLQTWAEGERERLQALIR